MADDVEFRSDLFHGAATDYETFRLGYPNALVDDLLRRSAVTGQGVCLDLACGTGQLAFALAPAFRAVWAVDQEPDMIALVRDKATQAGTTTVRPVACAAEDLDAPLAAFELVTVGNAFHRLRRDTVARRIFDWLQPGGHVALVWGDTPFPQAPGVGDSVWQTVLAQVLDRWKTTSAGRIPEGWEEPRRRWPDRRVLTDAGFEFRGRFSVSAEHRWTVGHLIGFVYSTSFLPRHVLGARTADFEADMHSSLDRFDRGEGLHQTINFAYELYRRSLTTI